MFASKLFANCSLCILLAYSGQTLGNLPAKCLQPKVTGPCRATFTRFFFNSATNACERFTYGGCRGNENNFKTQAECVAECESAVDPCSLPAKSGMCKAYFPRFYYDQTEGTCKSFVYGGCQGNANNFVSEADCLSRCKPDVCKLPKKVGTCKARKTRYFYNTKSGACEKFVYRGCESKGNRFTTLAKCEAKCVPASEDYVERD